MNRCDDCGRKHNPPKVRAGPMLKDEVWARIAKPEAWLCGDCVLQRAADQGIVLTFADLEPCMANLFGSPSWAEHFHG